MLIPDDIKYTKEHEWIRIVEQTAYVGITDFAQSELVDIVFLEFPNIGENFDQNDVFGTIEAVKTLADLYIPVSGSILEINETLDSAPELINNSPYDKGWIVKINLTNKDELNDLLDSNSYKELIR